MRRHLVRCLGIIGAAVALTAGSMLAPSASLHASVSLVSAPASGDRLEGSWSWPVAAPHPVVREYDVTGPYDAGHRGIDLGVAPGTAIVSPAGGTVRFAGVVVDRPVLSITHDDGSISSFEPVVAAVAQGDRVERGQLVGHVSTEVVHAPAGGVHLGARVDGEYRNPRYLLGEVPPAVLLPLHPDDS